MITVSGKEQNEKVRCVEQEIILCGPPAKLRGVITLSNDLQEAVLLQDVPIKTTGRKVLSQANLVINAPLSPGEHRRQRLNVTMPVSTVPGTYRQKVTIGGEEKTLTMIVQESLEIELTPSNIIMVGIKPGLTHTKEIILSNKGNVPFAVPAVRHNMTLDMDLICRNLSMALKETPDGDSKATLDAFMKGLKKDLTDWVEVRIAESGKIVQPGESLLLHISFVLPKDINPSREYEGDLRILDQLLSYMIIPGPKLTTTTARSAVPKKST